MARTAYRRVFQGCSGRRFEDRVRQYSGRVQAGDTKQWNRSVRIPIGYQADPFNLSLGRPLFAAKDIRAPVLVVRGEFDFGHVQQISIPLQGTSSIRPRLRRLRLEAGPTTCLGPSRTRQEPIHFRGIEFRNVTLYVQESASQIPPRRILIDRGSSFAMSYSGNREGGTRECRA